LNAPVHAGLIARWSGTAGWRGVLIEGPSGAGKSDLALRALKAGFRLVADDRVRLWSSAGALYGCAPHNLRGLIEVRGLGVLRAPPLPLARIDLVIHCAPGPTSVERLPEPTFAHREKIQIPLIKLWPFEPSAIAKLCRAIDDLGGGA
jgi:serine kinase of HPr protein (carbohydrate metabolism regulator)